MGDLGLMRGCWMLMAPLVVTVPLGVALGAGALTPAQILDAHDKTLAAYQVWSMTITSRGQAGGTLEEFGPTSSVAVIQYRRDHDRLDVDDQFYRIPGSGEVTPSPANLEVRRRAIVAEKAINYDVLPSGRARNASFTADAQSMATGTRYQLGGAQAMEGYLATDSTRVSDVLRAATGLKIREGMEDIDGHSCYVIDAVSEYGTYALWFDPSAGCLLRKAIVSKTEHDRYYAVRLGDIPAFQSKQAGPVKLQKYTYVMDNVQVTSVNGSFLPTTCRTTVTSEYTGGQAEKIVITHERKGIDFAPDFEALGAFRPDLPIGTHITNNDFPEIPYVWDKQGLTPYIDAEVVGKICATATQVACTTRACATSEKVVVQAGGSVESSAGRGTQAQGHVLAWVVGLILVAGGIAVLWFLRFRWGR